MIRKIPIKTFYESPDIAIQHSDELQLVIKVRLPLLKPSLEPLRRRSHLIAELVSSCFLHYAKKYTKNFSVRNARFEGLLEMMKKRHSQNFSPLG